MIAVRWRAKRAPLSALLLAGLLPVLSAAVPLLDRGDRVYAPVFAPEQGYESGALGHDHTICIQFAATATLMSEPGAFPFHQSSTFIPSPAWDRRVRARLRVLPRSRSPPLA